VFSYQAKLVPYVENPATSDFVAAGNMYLPRYVIVDGSRIGLWDNYGGNVSSADGDTLLGCEYLACNHSCPY
jgi:hypothetical protein